MGGNGGSLDVAEAGRFRCDHTNRGDGVLGIRTGELPVRDTEDFDAWLQCRYRRAGGFDSARQIGPQNQRKRLRQYAFATSVCGMLMHAS
jgi:hypothetical protein